MTTEELYAQYGKASVALEIAQGKYNEAKKALVEDMNKSAPVEVKDDGKEAS